MHVIIDWFKILVTQLPLEWFVLIGSFLDEVFPPIPSPLVMMGLVVYGAQEMQELMSVLKSEGLVE